MIHYDHMIFHIDLIFFFLGDHNKFMPPIEFHVNFMIITANFKTY